MIHYDKKGKGRKIVLIHGLTDDSSIWEEIEQFLKKYQLILIDLPGHGKSMKFKKFNWKVVVEEIDKVFEKEKIDEAVLVGFSLGGMSALKYASKNKKKIKGIVLISSTAYFEKKVPPNEFFKLLMNLEFGNFEEGIEVIKSISKMRPDFLFKGLVMGSNFDMRKEVKNFKIPALILSGDRDTMVTPRMSKITSKLMNAEYVELKGTHGLISEVPEKVGKEIKRFLKCIKY